MKKPEVGDGPRQDVRPKDARAALERWDEGGIVWTVEMGGLGPGYEQALQIAVWELVRFLLESGKKPEEVSESAYDDFLAPMSRKHGWGLSGAQAGAAKSLAFQFCAVGYRKVLDGVAEDRRIQVSRDFPQAPPPPAKGAPR